VTEPRPLFVDTNAFVAIYDESDDHHERANAVLDGIRDRSYPYGPLFTSRHVLSETATVLLYGSSHRDAVRALRNICESSSMNVLALTEPLFERTARQFEQYDDQQISFVDHMNAVLSAEYDIEHIFAFEEDFRTLGMTRVPVDTGEHPEGG
jgi:predicted nucleic acid-binding protein